MVMLNGKCEIYIPVSNIFIKTPDLPFNPTHKKVKTKQKHINTNTCEHWTWIAGCCWFNLRMQDQSFWETQREKKNRKIMFKYWNIKNAVSSVRCSKNEQSKRRTITYHLLARCVSFMKMMVWSASLLVNMRNAYIKKEKKKKIYSMWIWLFFWFVRQVFRLIKRNGTRARSIFRRKTKSFPTIKIYYECSKKGKNYE